MMRLIRIAICESPLRHTPHHADEAYSSRYYEGGLSSVYLWDQEDGGFAGVVLIKKSESHLVPAQSPLH